MTFVINNSTNRNVEPLQGNLVTRLEWLETNALSGYSSSSIICNTRKYHGLFVINIKEPVSLSGGTPVNFRAGRHVLLSTLEEIVYTDGVESHLSTRKHPNVYHPNGYNILEKADLRRWPIFTYKNDLFKLNKEILFVENKNLLLIKYSIKSNASSCSIRINPLLAYRHFHAIGKVNTNINTDVELLKNGISVMPYPWLPTLFIQADIDSDKHYRFNHRPDWYHNIEYQVEADRGFDHSEDLYSPGTIEIELSEALPVIIAISDTSFEKHSDDTIAKLWEKETKKRKKIPIKNMDLITHLAEQGDKFIISGAGGFTEILAGYPWFDAWGRDAMIALPGLAFTNDNSSRNKIGMEILAQVGDTARDGLIPNCFGADGVTHAYNSVDASLWYTWALQKAYQHNDNNKTAINGKCYNLLKNIITTFSSGKAPHVDMDKSGMLHVGDESTQLTWMDAQVNGKPVTPRNGCPVEINALWYNALAFSLELAEKYNDSTWSIPVDLDTLKATFAKRFWVYDGDYLADVWEFDSNGEHDDKFGKQDISIRPNQIFAAAMPYSMLDKQMKIHVIKCVTDNLLTPYGLRTLSKGSPSYCSHYRGGSEQRDSSYHQGTVWPWLLGAYSDAVLSVNSAESIVKKILYTLSPLFSKHLNEAGIGSISEIFDAEEPYLPDGSIAQAWSVSECIRLLSNFRNKYVDIYSKWGEWVIKN